MKLVSKQIKRDRTGYVTLQPEDDEDIWHLYNIIQEGDTVRATTIRRVQNESATGSVTSQRLRMSLTIQVSKLHFSAGSSLASTGPASNAMAAPGTSNGASLQISGRIAAENDNVQMGSFHTLDIEVNRNVSITKEEWDSIAVARVDEACVEGRGAEVGAIVLGEGTAAICLLSEHMTVIRQRIDVPVPRKRTGSTTLHEKGLAKFYETVYASFLRHIPFLSLKVIVLASPGFVKDAVYDYIFAEALRTNNKPLLQARAKFVRIHISSPHVHSLVEVLKSPEITSQLKETKFAREGLMLDKFFKMLSTDEQRAWYGPDQVALAVERGAVGTLLISDELFRQVSSDTSLRKKYVQLVEDVRERSGEVLVFSSMHESGQQLNQLTGVAAILNFPLDVDVVEAEEAEAKAAAEAEEAGRREQEEAG
ncbi:pelota [Exidia glandulosa HHB12029]|uniref:Protein DOM34 homolog n=1 Tax=Exidia glandulosa HHB12029 TaxID=1314781 RepID=A0A165QU31_EXIGL|nr:pelota [Exidia glandulosa HHB12029]